VVKWRRLRPGELDHELLWLGVSLAAAVIAFVWLQLGLPRPACVIHEATGLPCPGCGTTRCVQHLFAGSFDQAWRLNPLAFLSLIGLGLFDLYAATVLTFKLPRLRIEEVSESGARVFRVVVFTALGLNWLWVLASGV
jgi:hypothetical protein